MSIRTSDFIRIHEFSLSCLMRFDVCSCNSAVKLSPSALNTH